MIRRTILCTGAICLALPSILSLPANAQFFQQTNLVSDVPGMAANTDANLKNPWGIAFSDTSPFWVANQVTGTSTLYNGVGVPQSLVVNVTGGSPTGVVFNSTADFPLFMGGKAVFLFATLGGGIAGWNPTLGTTAELRVSTANAEYTGLALGTTAGGNFLYAANSAAARIDVFDSSFSLTTLAGGFVDPSLPAGFTPYNIANLAGTLYVTYENETSGGGVINKFDLNGNFIGRFTNNADGGPLDSPWGLVLTPGAFGPFGEALLVGNEDDGHISAFNVSTGAFLGQLQLNGGAPVANTGLWGLAFGNAGAGFDPQSLYFAAGVNDETGGLFGRLTPVPEPGGALLAAELLLITELILPQRQSRYTS